MKPDPSKFRRPQLYATWCYPRASTFKTHTTLGHAKSSLTSTDVFNKLGSGKRQVVSDMYVYQWDETIEEWVLLHHLPTGTIYEDHPFYSQKTPLNRRPVKGPSDAQVEKAIASITSVLERP